jgi:hypothetical protein
MGQTPPARIAQQSHRFNLVCADLAAKSAGSSAEQ